MLCVCVCVWQPMRTFSSDMKPDSMPRTKRSSFLPMMDSLKKCISDLQTDPRNDGFASRGTEDVPCERRRLLSRRTLPHAGRGPDIEHANCWPLAWWANWLPYTPDFISSLTLRLMCLILRRLKRNESEIIQCIRYCDEVNCPCIQTR